MFKELYKDSIVKSLKDKFNYGNIMQVPKLVKVCINMGVGDAATDSKAINEPLDSLYLIAGQKPLSTFAKIYFWLQDQKRCYSRLQSNFA